MRRIALLALTALCCTAPAAAQYNGGGYVPPSGGGGGGDLLAANNLSDVDDAETALANLGTLPAFRVCSTCAYTTIQSAITAADSAGGGVVKVAPGSYSEALTAAAGVHLLCDVPSAQVKACFITGTAGNPAITYDIGTPGGLREDHVSLAVGFLLVSGGGVGVPAVSVECPVAAAQRVELYEVDMFSASGSGQALRMTCGATGSGGLPTLARIHGEMTQLASQGGSTESVLYHSGGWLDARGYVAIDADSADAVALEVAAAGSGTVSVADFLLTGTVAIGAAATTAVTLSQGIVTSATVAPITTNGSGALSLGVVGLWAVAAAPAACIAGAGVVVHAPTSLSNVGNCGTLIASTVNGGAGPDFAGTFFASRLQQELLGTAALVDTGTAIGDVVLLEDVGGSPALPAVDGSQLTNLPSSGGDQTTAYRVCPTCTYTTIGAAITAADAVATAATPAVVLVSPGTYDEKLTLADFVSVECAGRSQPGDDIAVCELAPSATGSVIDASLASGWSAVVGFRIDPSGNSDAIAINGVAATATYRFVDIETDVAAANAVDVQTSTWAGTAYFGGTTRLVNTGTTSGGELIEFDSGTLIMDGSIFLQSGRTVIAGNTPTLIDIRGVLTATGRIETQSSGTWQISQARITSVGTYAPIYHGGATATLVLDDVRLDVGASSAVECVDTGGAARAVTYSPGSLHVGSNCTSGAIDSAATLTTLDAAGLGSAAYLDVGTAAGNVVQLDGSARLPAVDGSQLLNLPGGGGGGSTERVGAYRNAALALGAGNTDLVFDTERYDSGSDYDNTTGVFTAPSSGVYCINSAITMQANEYLVMVLWRDTGGGMAEYLRGQYDDGFHGADFGACPYLDAGDAVKLVGRIPSGSGNLDVSAATLNWLTIVGPL